MKVNELRVGNWFYRYCCNDQVMEVRAGGVIGLDRNQDIISLYEMKPIPLTEEFFEKNGFVKERFYFRFFYFKKIKGMILKAYKHHNGWEIHMKHERSINAFSKAIDYVHELQNAYYVSTGEEMEITL